METVNDTAMHVTETKTLCSSLTCPKSKSEEITREKEEELLYGSIEDGDDEDALSDDSIRLRVSDDEADLDEPSDSTNMNNDKAERKGSNSELASVIPSKDTLERKNGELSIEKLSNGICTFDNASSRISEDQSLANEDFASDVLPNTDHFFGVTENADGCNGEVDCEDKTQFAHQGESNERSQANRNPMNDYLRRGNHNSLHRQSHTLSSRFDTKSYNDRYYNKKYYGGGKGNNKGYNGHSRDSLSQDIGMDSKYPPRVFPSDDLQKVKDTREASLTNINIKDNDKETSCNQENRKIAEIGETYSNDVALSENIDSVKNRESISSEDKNEFSKNDDNAEAANDSLDSKNSTAVNNQISETTNIEESTADKSLNSEKNEVDVKCERNDVNVSVTSDETFVADEANDIAENCINEKEDESGNEIEPKIGEEMLKSTTESTNSTQNLEKILEKNGKDDPINKPDELTDPIPIVTETSQDPKTNETLVNMSDKVVEMTEVQSANEEEEAITIKESEANIFDDRKPLGIDDKSMIVCQNEATTGKQLIDETQKTIEESVATDNRTIDEKSVEPSNAEISSLPKISEIEHSIADLPDEKETSSDEEDEGNNVTVVHSSLKRSSKQSLDEMELSKRIRIQRKKSIDSNDCLESKDNEEVSAELKGTNEEKTEAEDNSDANPATNNFGNINSDLGKETSFTSCNTVTSSSCANENNKGTEDESGVDGDVPTSKTDDCEVIEVPVKLKQKRLRRSVKESRDSAINQEDTQEKENVRQKRRTARNAEEIIRKEFLGNSDSESNDSAGNFVAVNYNRTSNDSRAASPPSLKRNLTDDDDGKVESKCIKKLKHDFDVNGEATKIETLTRDDNVSLQTLHHVRHFFRRDSNGKLCKLKQEELEELLIQKVVETITMRDEIGKLRDQAKISERNQEATRLKCQQLSKQIKDFEMVLNRYNNDRRSNPEKTNIVPIKINRSVGLQVNFLTDHGIQNLRQLGQTQKSSTPTVNGVVMPQRNEQSPNSHPVIKRTVKVRSPRRPEPIAPASTAVPTALPSSVHNQPIISNITPAALVVAKSVQETRPSVTTAVQQANVSQLMASNQTILVNGLPNAPIRQTSMQVSKTKNNSDLIDLTQEEDKTKTTVIPQNAILTTPLTEAPANVTNVSNIGQRYHTVIQAIPGNVAITAPTGIRVVQPSSQPTPTALVNNMNAPRLAYVMQSGIGGQRQVVFTSTPTPIRPAPDHQIRPIRTTFPISGTITNGTVRVIPTSSTATLQVCKHPAALPESINPPSNVAWKLPPPAPSLKISKVANGIVLSWNMALSDKFADIASYQLYAYQEVAGIPPSSTLWKKVGDVRALPLPMACTLTQFSEGNNYYFAVRAVDRHSRLGMYSQPGNISL